MCYSRSDTLCYNSIISSGLHESSACRTDNTWSLYNCNISRKQKDVPSVAESSNGSPRNVTISVNDNSLPEAAAIEIPELEPIN